MSEDEQYNEYGIFVGAKVCLKKDPSCIGIVKHIDENLCEITTCNVCWIEQGVKFLRILIIKMSGILNGVIN